MRTLTQKQLNNMPTVSCDVLAATKNSIRNYVVYIGKTAPVMMEQVHVGLASTNHLDTIQDVLHGQPIFKVVMDTRKMA